MTCPSLTDGTRILFVRLVEPLLPSPFQLSAFVSPSPSVDSHFHDVIVLAHSGQTCCRVELQVQHKSPGLII